ncbi:MAG TPA: sugar phosphate isomerase/epimerase family protein [bacterium]|nr:sugar phosphate isomerase/epimerase family protein [bacterium]HOL34305.1 sugar phosphate isomerase/epimerase family protein [bacterium]HPP08611.1 sugar phosphate isomerase/epimerase family protein [bacterium]
MKIGVIPDCFRMPIKQAIRKAAELNLDGIQPYATRGDLSPENLSRTGRDELKKFVSDLGLEISAIVGDFGGHGFTDSKTVDWRVEKTKKVIDLAVDIGVNIVTTHIGVVPENTQAPEWKILLQSLPEIGSYAYNKGVVLATETGPEPAEILKKLLDELNNPGIKVNYDPANLVMVAGDDPVKGVLILKDYIVHTHAKDGIKLPDENGKKKWKELPLGEGNVNFPEYLKTMKDVGYKGFFTIEREVGDNPEADIIKAMDFLRDLGRKLNY